MPKSKPVRPKDAARHGYKGVEYGVQQVGPNEWKWAIYPRAGSDIPPKRGKLSRTRKEADDACKAAIEQAFHRRALR